MHSLTQTFYTEKRSSFLKGQEAFPRKVLIPIPQDTQTLRVLGATDLGRSLVEWLKENQSGFCAGLLQTLHTFTNYQTTRRRIHFAGFCKYTRSKLTFVMKI